MKGYTKIDVHGTTTKVPTSCIDLKLAWLYKHLFELLYRNQKDYFWIDFSSGAFVHIFWHFKIVMCSLVLFLWEGNSWSVRKCNSKSYEPDLDFWPCKNHVWSISSSLFWLLVLSLFYSTPPPILQSYRSGPIRRFPFFLRTSCVTYGPLSLALLFVHLLYLPTSSSIANLSLAGCCIRC